MKVNNIYVVVSNGLFKDPNEEDKYPGVDLNSQTIMLKSRRAGYSNMLSRQQLEEALGLVFVEPERERTMTIHTGQAGLEAFNTAITAELERQLDSVPIIYGTAGESQLENEQLWTDIRNETQTPEVDLSVMTEQEIINHFDTISNEEQ